MPELRRARVNGFRADLVDDLAQYVESGDRYTYAILDPGEGGAGAIKIGRSCSHPEVRRRDLQVANARELVLLAYSLAIREARAHQLLRQWHRRGEWYAVAAPVLRFIGSWDWNDVGAMRRLWAQVRGAEACHP
jgi:hypothetical protein